MHVNILLILYSVHAELVLDNGLYNLMWNNMYSLHDNQSLP